MAALGRLRPEWVESCHKLCHRCGPDWGQYVVEVGASFRRNRISRPVGNSTPNTRRFLPPGEGPGPIAADANGNVGRHASNDHQRGPHRGHFSGLRFRRLQGHPWPLVKVCNRWNAAIRRGSLGV